MSVIETSKSGRASCRKCKNKIEKGALRFGVESDMQYGEEPSYRWYHLECGAFVEPMQLEKLIKAYDGDIPNRAEVEKAIAEGKKKTKPPFPYAEVAPSGRSKCMQCEQMIEKGQLRVAVEREVDTGTFVSKSAGYLHVGCAVEHSGEGLPAQVLDNSYNLDEGQRSELQAAFG